MGIKNEKGDEKKVGTDTTFSTKSSVCPYFFILIFISLFLFTWKLGSLTFVDEDEATYAKVAQEMVTSGDWIYPSFNYSPFIDKPPIVYWGNALSFKLFGIKEFAIRFWHSIIAVLGVLVTFFIAADLFGARTGIFSGLILATSLQYFYQARMTLCDIPLTFFITLSLYFFIVFIRRRKISSYYFSIVAIALATLTKGPIGIMIPLLVIGIYLFFSRDKLFTDKSEFYVFTGLLVFFGIVSPWFIMQVLRYKWYFIKAFFLYTNLERAMHPIGISSPTGGPDPFYYYIFVIPAGFLPWTGAMYYGIAATVKKCLHCIKRRAYFQPEMKNELFILIWAGVVFILFSIFGMKAPRYILPIYPALAIMSGRVFALPECLLSAGETNRNFLLFLLSVIFAPFIIGAAIIAGRIFPEDASLYLPILMPTFIILGTGIFISSILFLKNKKAAFIGFLIAAFASYVALIIFSDIHFNYLRTSKPFAEIINKTMGEGDEIINYRPPYGEGFSLGFYTNHRLDFVRDEGEIISRLNSKTKVFCIVPRSELESLKGKIPINILNERMGRILFTNK